MALSFKGTYYHQIDDKNRMRLPSKLRDAIKGNYILCEGSGRYLCVYTEDYADRMSEKYSELLLSAKTKAERVEIEAQERDTFSTMDDLTEDKQGRFVIPSERLAYASIQKEIVILGANNRIEIWARETYLEDKKSRQQ